MRFSLLVQNKCFLSGLLLCGSFWPGSVSGSFTSTWPQQLSAVCQTIQSGFTGIEPVSERSPERPLWLGLEYYSVCLLVLVSFSSTSMSSRVWRSSYKKWVAVLFAPRFQVHWLETKETRVDVQQQSVTRWWDHEAHRGFTGCGMSGSGFLTLSLSPSCFLSLNPVPPKSFTSIVLSQWAVRLWDLRVP